MTTKHFFSLATGLALVLAGASPAAAQPKGNFTDQAPDKLPSGLILKPGSRPGPDVGKLGDWRKLLSGDIADLLAGVALRDGKGRAAGGR